MSKFSSAQEAAIAHLSKTVLGSQALFAPENYGHPQNEPADLVWISGRCAVIMYMTSSRRRFSHKRTHNVDQMHRWIDHWQKGEVLRGDVRGNTVSYAFSDIDYIIGLSIVGGNDTGSIYEHNQMVDANSKLMGCATISDLVFNKLSSRIIGLNDLIDFLNILEYHPNKRIRDDDGIKIVEGWTSTIAELVRSNVESFLDIQNLNISWKEIRQMIFEMSKQDKLANANDIIADISCFDALWLNVAEQYSEIIRSKNTSKPRVGNSLTLISDPYKLGMFGFDDSSQLSAMGADQLADCDIGLISISDFAGIGRMRMMTFGPNEKPKRYISRLIAHQSQTAATISRGDHMRAPQQPFER